VLVDARYGQGADTVLSEQKKKKKRIAEHA